MIHVILLCLSVDYRPQQTAAKRFQSSITAGVPADYRVFLRGQVELPRWVGATSESPRLVEAEPGICEGLVKFCLAEAQQMAIGKVSAACGGISTHALSRREVARTSDHAGHGSWSATPAQKITKKNY